MVDFTVSPCPRNWQTGCIRWEVAQSRFHVDLKLNLASKNNSLGFLPGPITLWINVMYESQMKWTWHHSQLAVEVSFVGRLRVVLLQLLTLNVRGPSYLGLTRSISWLLMPWLLMSPGHKQPWYWLYRMCRSFSYLRKDFKYVPVSNQCGGMTKNANICLCSLWKI